MARSEKKKLSDKKYQHSPKGKATKKRWREANKVRVAAGLKAYHDSPKGRATRKRYREANKERIAATCKKWYETNKEKTLAYGKLWYAANKERHAATVKKWNEANQERIAAQRFNRNYGPNADLAVHFLTRQQGGRSYLTGEPLMAPTFEHCHTDNVLRGICNENENFLLANHCGDSYASCLERLAKLKCQDGKLATFIRGALPGLKETPAMKAGIRFVVTGALASHKMTAHQRRVANLENLVSLIRAGAFKTEDKQTNSIAA